MIFDQTSIYDFLSVQEDEIYIKLCNLKKGDNIRVGSHAIYLNDFELYQVYKPDEETAFSTVNQCYEYIIEGEKISL